MDEPRERRELRVLRGNPDDHELAALVAVHALLSRRRPQEHRRSWWSRPRPAGGPGAWRRSGLPG